MTLLPPPFPPALFRSLETDRVAETAARFAPVVADLQAFLNGLPPLDEVQHVRARRFRKRRRPTFVRPARAGRGHWWFTHEGARNEAQWNVGMFACHLRFGIGFNASRGGWGKPERVRESRARFLDRLRAWEAAEPGFAARERLEAEIWTGTTLEVVPAADLLAREDGAGLEPWLFVGRLLRSGPAGREAAHPGCEGEDDAALLATPLLLAEELARVGRVLWPLWEEHRLSLAWA
jgi:hypothetical protein